MSHADTRPPLSDLTLERFRLGELPPAEMQAITARLADDQALRERLAALEASDRAIAAAHPSADMAAAIARRASTQAAPVASAARPATRRRGWLVPAAVAVACVCIAAVGATLVWRPPAVDDTTIKGSGDAALVLHRKTAAGSEELRDGAVARRGDQIRVGYRAAGHTQGALLSVDGRGTVTQHLPQQGDRSVPLTPSGTVFLDFAYELDDAPRFEAFYLVTADAPFALDPVRQAVRDAAAGAAVPPAALRLPSGLAAVRFVLTKDSR